jgi:hypothetical protein
MKFAVIVGRPVTETAVMMVEADSVEAARELAEGRLASGEVEFDDDEWEYYDDGGSEIELLSIHKGSAGGKMLWSNDSDSDDDDADDSDSDDDSDDDDSDSDDE